MMLKDPRKLWESVDRLLHGIKLFFSAESVMDDSKANAQYLPRPKVRYEMKSTIAFEESQVESKATLLEQPTLHQAVVNVQMKVVEETQTSSDIKVDDNVKVTQVSGVSESTLKVNADTKLAEESAVADWNAKYAAMTSLCDCLKPTNNDSKEEVSRTLCNIGTLVQFLQKALVCAFFHFFCTTFFFFFSSHLFLNRLWGNWGNFPQNSLKIC